jgi:hypothetical protein
LGAERHVSSLGERVFTETSSRRRATLNCVRTSNHTHIADYLQSGLDHYVL